MHNTVRWKLRISISQLNILHPPVFFFPITFKNKTTHFVQPKNSYSLQRTNRQPRSRFMILRSLPVGRMQPLAQGCPRSSTDLARRRTGPTRLIPQNMRGKGAPSSVGSRLLPKKFSAACLVGEQTRSRKVFRSSKCPLPVTLAVFNKQICDVSVAFATSL